MHVNYSTINICCQQANIALYAAQNLHDSKSSQKLAVFHFANRR